MLQIHAYGNYFIAMVGSKTR